MGDMYLMCGLSGAGKTTYAKTFAKQKGYTYLGIDDFYAPYYANDKNVYDKEEISFNVWIDFYKAIFEAEMRGETVVIDTNAPTAVKRLQFIDWFGKFKNHYLIYIKIDDELLQSENNHSRNRIVPIEELRRMKREFEEPIIMTKDKGRFYPKENKWDKIYVMKNINNVLVVIPEEKK